MSEIKNQAEIEAIRRRLYERGEPTAKPARPELSPLPIEAPSSWDVRTPVHAPEKVVDPRIDTLTEPTVEVEAPDVSNIIAKNSKRYSYRSIILLSTLAFFVVVSTLSTLYLLFGNNQISNQNIGIALTGPLTIGGGEVLPLQATITNQNKVPIESVVLIMNYPSGTKSADGNGKDIFEERIDLDAIGAGESLNIPVRAVVFGEENQEKEIKATIEYRLKDSNGTIYKQADPFTFKIHSSPVVIRVENVKKVSSGQEVEIKLNIQSNASALLKNILVTADLPLNFSMKSSTPEPIYRDNTWLISEIKPEQSISITLRGVVTGNQNEEFQIRLSAGSPRQDNQFLMGSILATAGADFLVERPFIDINTTVNGSSGETVTTTVGDSTLVNISVKNTLDDTLYDMVLEVDISGSVLSRDQVKVEGGFYDSVEDKIRFEVAGKPDLSEVSPGDTRRFTFSLVPNKQQNTPTFQLNTSAFARRVNENRVTEQLVGVAKTEVRYTSVASLTSEVRHQNGPVPPVADEATIYRVTIVAESGGNDLTGAVVTTSLPQYVKWMETALGDGTVVYNPVSKELTWTIGTIEADSDARTSFQLSFTPSQSQIGATPSLVGQQRLQATDRFTNATVRADKSPLTTELSRELGFDEDSGRVVREMVESGDN